MRGLVSAALRAWALLLTCQCSPGPYSAPDLAPNQAAAVTVDDRASVTVEGHPVVDDFHAPIRYFSVSTECHELTATYDEEYVIVREQHWFIPLMPVTSALAGAAVTAGTSETHHYKTQTPIAFHVLAKPGMKYWVTATFNGDEFLPRIVVLSPQNERVGVIAPNVPCAGASAAVGK